MGDDSTGDARKTITDMFADIEDRKKANSKRITRAGKRGGGGGRGSKKEKDEVDVLIQNLKTKLDAAEALVKAGEVSNVDLDETLSQAKSKLDGVIGQIATLQSKMNAGTLSTKEQERLNTLVSQQSKLTSFIREEEQRIALLKMQQGQYAEGLLLTTGSWVRENLSMSKSLQEGITGALSNAKGALTEFFSSWSDGTKKGKEAFKDLTVSVLKSIQQMFAEMLTIYLLQKALGWVDKTFGLNLSSYIPSKEGGMVRRAAQGEYVKGNLNRDSQNYKLMPGEYVLRRSAVQAIGVDELDRLNSMGNRVVSGAGSLQNMAATSPNPAKATGAQSMNIYLVDERSKAGALGPSDIVAVISDDISKGGTTKKLIKSVQMGNT